MVNYFVNYAEANIVCLIIFGIMLVHDLLNAARQESQIKFDRALIAFMLYFVSDSLWAAVIGGILPQTRFIVIATNFANYVFMAMLTYMWLRYAMAVEKAPNRERRINKLAVISPFFVSTVALIATYCIAPQALLPEETMLPTPLYDAFLITVPIINIAAVLVYMMRKAGHDRNPVDRKKHLYIGLFPMIVIAGGLLQKAVLPSSPIFCFACTILMLVFYIQSMETQISLDPLTGLNNRGQLIRYVSQENNLHVEGRKTFVLMIDINDFKTINDTYGHAEGDRALVLIADALKKTAGSRTAQEFLGRYGGDEFILIVHLLSENGIAPLIGDIRGQIEEACRENKTPYLLSIGVGYDGLMDGQDTFQKCLQRADHKLYLDKEFCKIHGQTTVFN